VVILVEDDEGLRAALKRVLRAWGFETKAFASAEDALADSDLDWPDCLVVDLNLPALSGLDLVDRLRQRGVTAPAVMISAQDEARVRDELRRRGIRHFLPKPFLGSALVRTVDAALEEGSGGDRALR
jgi:FixJ family two-component response regulator